MYFKPLRRSINQRKARLLKKGMRRKMGTARSMVDQAINHYGAVIGTKQCINIVKNIEANSHRHYRHFRINSLIFCAAEMTSPHRSKKVIDPREDELASNERRQ
jgi:hypothetical protein